MASCCNDVQVKFMLSLCQGYDLCSVFRHHGNGNTCMDNGMPRGGPGSVYLEITVIPETRSSEISVGEDVHSLLPRTIYEVARGSKVCG